MDRGARVSKGGNVLFLRGVQVEQGFVGSIIVSLPRSLEEVSIR